MARIVSVTFETTSESEAGRFSIPQLVAEIIGIQPKSDIELRVSWEGRIVELAAVVGEGLEVRHRAGDVTTAGLQGIPKRTPLLVTVWKGEPEPSDVAERADARGYWSAQDGGADFAKRAEAAAPERQDLLRRLIQWARALEQSGHARLFSFHGDASGVFTLLPYLNQHDAGLVTIWGDGWVTLHGSVFGRFAPRSVKAVESQIGKAIGRSTYIRPITDEALVVLREAYEEAARTPAAGKHRTWGLSSILEEIAQRHGQPEADVAERLLEWGAGQGLRLSFGKGAVDGSAYLMYDNPSGLHHWIFSVWTSGGVGLELGYLKQRPAFASRERRLQLIQRLNRIPGVSVSETKADLWPSLRLSDLVPAGSIATFLEVYEWVLDQYRNSVR
jgi:hypothetical protein